MINVSQNQITETHPNCFVTEASQLGMKPGEWAPVLETDMGNGMRLLCTSVERGAEGEINFVEYQQVNGVIKIKVFND